MAFPYRQTDLDPVLLRLLAERGTLRSTEAYELLADHFGVTLEDRKIPRPDPRFGFLWANWVQTVRGRLVTAGWATSAARGVWSITEAGRKAAAALDDSTVPRRYSPPRRREP